MQNPDVTHQRRPVGCTTVAIEIEHSEEPIRGAITAGTGRHRFYGWLELTAALEALRAQQADDRSDGDNRRQSSLPSHGTSSDQPSR